MLQRLLMAHQQLPVGASTQLTGAHNQTREALAVRSLISECVQLVKLLRTLYQWRLSPAMRNLEQLGQRDAEAQIMTAVRQVRRLSFDYCVTYFAVKPIVWAPLYPLVHLLPHFFPFSLFPFFHWLYLFSFVHPFPFYQNSPAPFPGRRS